MLDLNPVGLDSGIGYFVAISWACDSYDSKLLILKYPENV
jgi:hypothetical protein